MDDENTGIDEIIEQFETDVMVDDIDTDIILHNLSMRTLTSKQRQALKSILYEYSDANLDDEFWKDLLDFFRESGYDYPTSPLKRMINKIEDVVYDR